jgi:hypothetical protein
MTALAVEAFAPAMETFKCGRDFAAWLGLVPRQMSSGGKERLGRISKAGQSDIRRLLIIGAMSRLNWMGAMAIREGSWLDRLRARKPKMLVAIALANKMARMIWAMLTKQQDYNDPVPAGAAWWVPRNHWRDAGTGGVRERRPEWGKMIEQIWIGKTRNKLGAIKPGG